MCLAHKFYYISLTFSLEELVFRGVDSHWPLSRIRSTRLVSGPLDHGLDCLVPFTTSQTDIVTTRA